MKPTWKDRTMYAVNVVCFYVNIILAVVNAILGNIPQCLFNLAILGVCLLGIDMHHERFDKEKPPGWKDLE
jgi:hypothetical protein